MTAAAQIFANPKKEYQKLIQSLYQQFSKEVIEEIEAFVEEKSQEKFNKIYSFVSYRFKKLEALYAHIEKEEEPIDQHALLREFFELANPKSLAEDIKFGLEFNEIKKDYHIFIDQMSKGSLGKVFLRYRFDGQVFDFLVNGLLEESNLLIDRLESYSKKVIEHFLLLKKIRDGEKGKAFLKTATSLGGLVFGIPFAGLAAGAILNEDHSQKIEGSIKEVEDRLHDYEHFLFTFLQDLQQRYEHILLSIYGGTLIRVNKQFIMNKVQIKHLNLLHYTYELEVCNEEKIRVRKWALDAMANVKNLLVQNRVDEAIIVSNRFFHAAETNPMLKPIDIKPGKSLIHLANTTKFAALSHKAMIIKKQDDTQFLLFVSELFKQLPYFVNDEDLEDFEATFSVDLLIHFIGTTVQKERSFNENKALWENVIKHVENMIQRIENEEIAFEGELPTDEDDPLYLELIRCLALFLDYDFKHKNKVSQYFHSRFPATRVLNELQSRYKKIHRKDKFYSLLTFGKGSHITLKVISILIKPFNTVKRAFVTVSLMIFLISGILLTQAGYVSKVVGWTENLFTKETDKEKAPTNSDNMRILPIVKVNVEAANIRSEPSLNSSVTSTAILNDRFYVLKEEKDAEGRLWMNVCPAPSWNGTSCTIANLDKFWISSKLTTKE